MEESSVGQRFLQLIQQLGMSKNAFAMSLDKTATVIQHLVDERNKPGFDLMCKVFKMYPNVSKDWLLLGKGPMLLPGAPDSLVKEIPEVAVPVPLAKPIAAPVAPATPSFPAPLFAVSTARPPLPEVPALPAEPAAPAVQEAAAATSQPVATPALGAVAPEIQPLTPPSPSAAPSPLAPAAAAAPLAPVASSAPLDAAALTAALHAQYLQHQLALAEQRNQHLLEQQALMQQMIDLLRRPV